MEDCLTFFGGTSIFYSRGNKFKKLLLSLYLSHKRKPANPTLILSPSGYSWGQSAYPHSFKPLKKHKNRWFLTKSAVKHGYSDRTWTCGLRVMSDCKYIAAVQSTIYCIFSVVYTIYCVYCCLSDTISIPQRTNKEQRLHGYYQLSPGNRQLDSTMQNSYTKGNKRALSTDG